MSARPHVHHSSLVSLLLQLQSEREVSANQDERHCSASPAILQGKRDINCLTDLRGALFSGTGESFGPFKAEDLRDEEETGSQRASTFSRMLILGSAPQHCGGWSLLSHLNLELLCLGRSPYAHQ